MLLRVVAGHEHGNVLADNLLGGIAKQRSHAELKTRIRIVSSMRMMPSTAVLSRLSSLTLKLSWAFLPFPRFIT
jgi:hypothetical protein